MITTRRPDAVLVPKAWKTGKRQALRVESILKIAEPLLGVQRSKGELGWIKTAPVTNRSGQELLFVTRRPDSIYYYPANHNLQGRSRYTWEDSGQVRLGYLADEFRSQEDFEVTHPNARVTVTPD